MVEIKPGTPHGRSPIDPVRNTEGVPSLGPERVQLWFGKRGQYIGLRQCFGERVPRYTAADRYSQSTGAHRRRSWRFPASKH